MRRHPGGILTLDLSSTTGVAYGHPADGVPETWRYQLPRLGGEGAKYAQFAEFLHEDVAQLQPCRIVLEKSLSFQALLGVSNMATMNQQLTLRGLAYAEAYWARASIQEVSADIVRQQLLGQSRFGKDRVKTEVFRYCKRRGIKCEDHNAADAAMLWLWFVGQITGRPAVAGPLFQEGIMQ